MASGCARRAHEREPSLLVLGISEEAAVALALRFRAGRLVMHVLGGASRMVMCGSDREGNFPI